MPVRKELLKKMIRHVINYIGIISKELPKLSILRQFKLSKYKPLKNRNAQAGTCNQKRNGSLKKVD